MQKIETIERFILEQERYFPDATGALTGLLYDVALAAKLIATRTTRAQGWLTFWGAPARRTCRARRSRSWIALRT